MCDSRLGIFKSHWFTFDSKSQSVPLSPLAEDLHLNEYNEELPMWVSGDFDYARSYAVGDHRLIPQASEGVVTEYRFSRAQLLWRNEESRDSPELYSEAYIWSPMIRTEESFLHRLHIVKPSGEKRILTYEQWKNALR